MNIMKRLQNKFESLIEAVNRFPIAVLFLLAIAIVNARAINYETNDYSTFIFTFVIGALLSAVAQLIYERFFTKMSERVVLMGAAALFTFLYFIAIGSVSVFNTENWTKTAVMMFALAMVFIWGPTIKSKITFNDSFMATFKALAITVLFTAVIAGGVSSIIFAIDQLLFHISTKATPHALNFIFSLFAPILFLSFTPHYPGKRFDGLSAEERILCEETIEKATRCPRNLEILISYIVIPLSAVYTLILLTYVLLNIRVEFWTENGLEPMLVSYSITMILVYIFASTIENPIAAIFRKIFPKVLVAIVLFQTTASILKITETGITHGRYYVILFGIFALIAGLIFSFMPPQKNGLIACVLIVFATISIVPPIDAFTVSRVNQIHTLESLLLNNQMLQNGEITSSVDVSTEDKIRITERVRYLDRMNYVDDIEWLPNDIFYDDRFKETFGFAEKYEHQYDSRQQSRFAHLDWEQNPVLNIEGYDAMIHLYINSVDANDEQVIELEANGKHFSLLKKHHESGVELGVHDENSDELITIDTTEITEHLFGEEEEAFEGNKHLTVEKATLTKENEQMKMTILVQSIDQFDSQIYGDFILFLDMK